MKFLCCHFYFQTMDYHKMQKCALVGIIIGRVPFGDSFQDQKFFQFFSSFFIFFACSVIFLFQLFNISFKTIANVTHWCNFGFENFIFFLKMISDTDRIIRSFVVGLTARSPAASTSPFKLEFSVWSSSHLRKNYQW